MGIMQYQVVQRLLRATCVLALVTAAACGGGGSGNGVRGDGGASTGATGGTSGTVDPNDVGTGAGLISAVCSAVMRCSDPPLVSSQQACQNLLTAAFGCDPMLASAKVTGLKACSDSLKSTSCNLLAESGFPTSECVAAVESLQRSLGGVGVGEVCEQAPCVGSAECTSDGVDCLRCRGRLAKEGQPCGDFGCEGASFCASNQRCTRPSPEGKACEFSEECESGACSQGICRTPAVGDACEEQEECGNALGCRDGKCQKLGKPGEACNDQGQCTFDALCMNDRCTSIPVCGSGGMGGVCFADGQCMAGLACGDDGCVRPAKRGERCDEVPCATGLTCFLSDIDDVSTCEVEEVRTPEECAAEEQAGGTMKARRLRAIARKTAEFGGWARLR